MLKVKQQQEAEDMAELEKMKSESNQEVAAVKQSLV